MRQEQYFHYIVDEAVPLILEKTNGRLPMTTGLSMGANHALNTFLRRPDLFSGVLALSGVYDSDYFFDGWMDGTLYMNSPERYLPNMPKDHPYIDIYNKKQIIICVGQGAWEEEGVRTLRYLQSVFADKGINAWCDFWGYDVNHDWPWWFKQMRYFIPILLERQ
jgi:esterase/lipase superfamily enzyme